MSARMYMPDQHAQRSADGKITLVVSQAHEMPPLPYELSGLVEHDLWDQRTRTIKGLCARFSKPLPERIWFIIAMICTLVLPFPLYRLIFNAVFDRNRPNDTFLEARAAGFGVFVGVLVLFWGPLALWKWLGASRMRGQLRQWEAYDRSNANGRFVPEWKVEMPGIFFYQRASIDFHAAECCAYQLLPGCVSPAVHQCACVHAVCTPACAGHAGDDSVQWWPRLRILRRREGWVPGCEFESVVRLLAAHG